MTEVTNEEIAPIVHRSDRSLSRSLDNRSLFEKKFAVGLILISVGFERLAFYSLAGNLTFFLDSNIIGWVFPHTIIAPLIFLGTSYLSAVIFSRLSDGPFGRAKTIIIGFIIYNIGYLFIILLANRTTHENLCPSHSNASEHTAGLSFFTEHCIHAILPVLIVIAIGVGAIQTNLAIFGAEQVREQARKTRYFDIYYAAINTGGLIAFGGIAYLQLAYNYFLGYLIPGILLLSAFILFLIGYKYYIEVKSTDSVIEYFFPVIINAFRTWKEFHRHRNENIQENFLYRDDAVIETEGDSDTYLSFIVSRSKWSFLDYARIRYHGRFSDRIINDIKSLRRIMVVFLLLIPYWLLYFQVETTFIVQGAHMRLPKAFRDMPVVWLSLGNQIIIIVTIFILNAFVYKRLRASGRDFPVNTRIFIGMCSATLAMCTAGTVEIIRQNTYEHHNLTQMIGGKNYTAADMSVFYQFPQYVGIGLSEVFTSVASLEFAYSAAPRSAQSLIMSLRFCSAGLSSFLGTGLVGLLSLDQDGQDPQKYRNDDRYYIYFFVLAGLQIVSMLIFLGCDRQFQLLKITNRHLKSRHFIPNNSHSSSIA